MSLRSTSGSSLVEVMVMMVILSISIVGIYSMVNSGQKLASLTDTRLTAINIAREGLESVTTLRDTFALKNYESGKCEDSSNGETSAFFSTNGSLLFDYPVFNCPKTWTNYILTDEKKLTDTFTNTSVCINEFGWYSQEYSNKTATPKVPCTSSTPLCVGNVTQSCRTRFQRKITFKSDSGCNWINNTQYCVEIISKVWWWTDETNADTSLTLQQIITPLD